MFEKWFEKEEKKEENEVVKVDKDNDIGTVYTNSIEPAPETPPITLTGHEKEGQKEEQEEPQLPPLTYKEVRALKKSGYEKIAEDARFKNTYVLLNKKTKQIVEIRAASSFHACNIIGWKANKVKVLQVNKVEEKESSTIDK